MADDPAVPVGEILLYASDDGQTRLSVRVEKGTVWLTQRLIAELIGASVPNIKLHIYNI